MGACPIQVRGVPGIQTPPDAVDVPILINSDDESIRDLEIFTPGSGGATKRI
jgi:hypothetical protein